MSWNETEECDYCGNRNRVTRDGMGGKRVEPCNHDGKTSLWYFNFEQEEKNKNWCTKHDRWKDGRDEDCP